ncbi:MAG TPA: tetratricopeptide repeat protein [Acidimicrobiia bacterium]|jgi:predicted ATPase/serine/threonine-protein kinase RIO1|nr:tetratricopeptide repeat protein [Acidimicrobiia bacterium]
MTEVSNRTNELGDPVVPSGANDSRAAQDNLPLLLTSFVGRGREVTEVVQLLETGRLVTVTGVPGSGKSRLAIETARALRSRYEHGVRYANLAACADDESTAEAIASALKLTTATNAVGVTMPGTSTARAAVDTVAGYAANRELLLVLDDAEHAARAVARLATVVLPQAPRLRILVASRVSLTVGGELVWQVPPLEVPGAADPMDVVATADAVRMFLDRARAAGANLQLTPETYQPIVRICRRLEGNPLALELAASRVKSLGLRELSERLESSLELLASSGRQTSGHHQTLLGAIEWGFDLLSRVEQRLFAALSVFRSDFLLEGAEAVAAAADIAGTEVVDLMGSLVDKSMVTAEGEAGRRRYRIGEALREFAAGRLEADGGTLAAQRSHALYHRDYVAKRAPIVQRSFDVDALDQLDWSQPDLIAAMEFLLESGDAETAHEMVSGLYLFWFARRHKAPAALAARIIAMPQPVAEAVKARATGGVGLLDVIEGRTEQGSRRLLEARAIAEGIGLVETVAETTMYLGFVAQQQMRLEDAATQLRDAQRRFEEAGVAWGTAWSTWFLGVTEIIRGDPSAAEPHLEAALDAFRNVPSDYGVANTLSMLGGARRMQGDVRSAIAMHRESLDLLTTAHDRQGIASASASLGLAYRDAGQLDEAAVQFGEAIRIARGLGNRPWLAELLYLQGETELSAGEMDEARESLEEALAVAVDLDEDQARGAAKAALTSLAWWSSRSGYLERAVTLFAAADNVADVPRTHLVMKAPADPESALIEARSRLGTQVYEALRAGGRTMSLREAIDYAREPIGEEPSFGLRRALTLEEVELGERVSAELSAIGDRREVRVAGIRLAGRRRRPSGEKAALPRDLRNSGRFWLLMGFGIGVMWLSLYAFPGTRAWWEERDLVINQWFAARRTDPLTDLMDVFHAMGSVWFFRPLRWAMLLALVFFKRWRHFFAAIMVFVLVEIIIGAMAESIGRPRPFVEILAPWRGFSHPSAPVASVAATFGVIGLALIPRGKWRSRWALFSGVLLLVLIVARTYLAVDHLSDGPVAAIFGIAMAVVIFRLFAPDSVFPVDYRRGTTAHLDISGARGQAITTAVADQLGIAVTKIEHFGLEGSGGSTPLRLTAAGDPDTHLFAKLYSTSHLRADRWYKVGRTILYGALEDEVRFTSVRRLVEYEDYMLLRMKVAGVPSAEPYGFVEITPEREYVIVTEFLQDAKEITKADVDDAVIDDGLLMIRRLWDAGLAHRDVKPANVLVKDGRIRLIDVAFATIRPSPWRQAVDLANMLIILALQTDAERVYNRALRYFAPGDIAEAFAATRSVTIPSQSRSQLKAKRREGRDLIQQFRQLAPAREPIAIQRWSARRIGLTLGAAFAIAVLVSLFLQNLTSGGLV